MTVSRRTLMGGMLACAAVASVPLVRQGTLDYGLDLIRRQFGHSVADDPQARRFLEDYVRRKVEPRWPEGTLIEAYLDLGLDRAKIFRDRLRVLDEDIVQNFILSTNVLDVARLGTPLAYNGFYDPYETPCANPLSVYNHQGA